jgi:hypothetical protein
MRVEIICKDELDNVYYLNSSSRRIVWWMHVALIGEVKGEVFPSTGLGGP